MHDRLFAFLGELLNGKPSRWVWHGSANAHAAYPLLAILLCLSTVSARADMLPSLVWNCWGSGQNPTQINCIHKREPLSKPALDDPDSELEVQVLGQLQQRQRNGKIAKVEDVEWRNIEVLHKGARWTIKVNSYPHGKLLDESQLNKLVTAVLCTSDVPCTVAVRNTSQHKAGEAK